MKENCLQSDKAILYATYSTKSELDYRKTKGLSEAGVAFYSIQSGRREGINIADYYYKGFANYSHIQPQLKPRTNSQL
jgi:hypothetical protein